MAGRKQHLRLVAPDERRVGPPAPKLTTVDAALASMRLCVAIVEAQPVDLLHGFNPDEIAAQYVAVDDLVAAFRTLDKLLTKERQLRVSKSGHPSHEKKES